MIFGTDTGKDQPDGTYAPGAFEIVNIEDPGFETKAERNARESRPCDAYVWCYSNTTNESFFRWGIARAQAAGVHRVWLDYEEEGLAGNWRIDLWFQICDELGIRGGYYGNDWRFDHSRYRNRPFWYSGYPDPNDGLWRDGFTPIAGRDVQLFQFTSSNGTLDRNAVWDPDWWTAWAGATSQTALLSQEEDDVQYVMSDQPGVKPAYRVWEHPVLGGPVKKLIQPAELKRLAGESFLGLVKTNSGQPFAAAPGFLDSIPDLPSEFHSLKDAAAAAASTRARSASPWSRAVGASNRSRAAMPMRPGSGSALPARRRSLDH